MGIKTEFNPELTLRAYDTDNRRSDECLPKKLIGNTVHNFEKRGQRNYWLEGEVPLRETEGNGKVSRILASVTIDEATHKMIDGEVWTIGRYTIKEAYEPHDNLVYFEGLEKVSEERIR